MKFHSTSIPPEVLNKMSKEDRAKYDKDFRVESARPVAILECDPGSGSLAASQAQERHTGKFLVRVTSRRRRLIDEDNLCEKFHVDCCRYTGVIPGDSPECAHIEVSQEKVSNKEQEETLIQIFEQ